MPYLSAMDRFPERFLSTSVVSLDMRLTILPRGVTWKKDIGAARMRARSELCNTVAANSPSRAASKALTSWKSSCRPLIEA